MGFTIYIFLLITLSFGIAINRPVYKIRLTQKGFAQFLQYDVDTPPLREFTFCIWIKFYDFNRDQTIFNYRVQGNDNVVRLWLDSGGRYIKISLSGKVTSSNVVDLAKDVWQHICLSYQSDYGAWALYLDGRLISCEVAQTLQRFVIPPGGSVIIGYGTSHDGNPGGIEGEIFGANMILASTIERNHTMKRNPLFRQRYFHKNKVTRTNDINYIVLGDMQTAMSYRDIESTTAPIPTKPQSYVSIKTPYSFVEHEVGLNANQESRKNVLREISYSEIPKTGKISDDDKITFLNLLGETISEKDKRQPTAAQYEMRPSSVMQPSSTNNPVIFPGLHGDQQDNFINKDMSMSKFTRKTFNFQKHIPTINIPKHTSIAGHNNNWSNSDFAKSVLNYLKTNNINIKPELKKVPPTIPLVKFSDSFPYASDFRVVRAHAPYFFQSKQNSFYTSVKIRKRDIQKQNMNIRIDEEIRNHILKSHSEIRPKNIDIESRSKNSPPLSRNIETLGHGVILPDKVKPRPFSLVTSKLNKSMSPNEFREKSINTILQFPKLKENLATEHASKVHQNNRENSTRSIFHKNKWHNVKSFNNDYTPQKIYVDTQIDKNNSYYVPTKKLPSIRLKYIPDNHKAIKSEVDRDILKGRNLAIEVSNFSNPFSDSVSILKYNHGFLPGHIEEKKRKDELNSNNLKNSLIRDNFNKNIKIGNALNEQFIIGNDEIQNEKSFVGGNDKVPDINIYRSDLDQVNYHVPPSLGPKVCKNLELFDRLLYIQPDGSIDVTHIISPLREKNIGISFILQNYKKCSLEDSELATHPFLFIDWNNTPLRLFGGAKPKKTTDLCGFF